MDKVESHDVLEAMKLVSMLERGLKACGVNQKDVKWKILSNPTGRVFIFVEFRVK
jgi:hypothetical protein